MSAHVEVGFGPLELEALPADEQAAAAAHLAGCDACAAGFRASAEALAAVALSAPPVQPVPSMRDRLLASVAVTSRFAAFADQVASLLDVTVEKSRELLARVDDASAWTQTPLEGVSSYDLDGGPAVADALVGFVKVQPGHVFPEHEHVGDEVALIIQGASIEASGRVARRGDLVRMGRGSAHELKALPGPAFIYLGIAQQGFMMFGMHIKKGDPRG